MANKAKTGTNPGKVTIKKVTKNGKVGVEYANAPADQTYQSALKKMQLIKEGKAGLAIVMVENENDIAETIYSNGVSSRTLINLIERLKHILVHSAIDNLFNK